jgi:hypothetical protein
MNLFRKNEKLLSSSPENRIMNCKKLRSNQHPIKDRSNQHPIKDRSNQHPIKD